MPNNTKGQITDLALTLVQKKGYTNFSYDDIAKQLKVTKAAIHYHFEGKEDLGIAVCEKVRESMLTCYKINFDKIKYNRASPWEFIKDVLSMIGPNENCPISSLQADYENLSEKFQKEIAKTSQLQIDLFLNLVKEYSPNIDNTILVVIFLSIKGALQCRRILGEDFFNQNIHAIKEQLDNILTNAMEESFTIIT